MNLLIDNNDGQGRQDYTAWVDGDHLPTIARKLNVAATRSWSQPMRAFTLPWPALG